MFYISQSSQPRITINHHFIPHLQSLVLERSVKMTDDYNPRHFISPRSKSICHEVFKDDQMLKLILPYLSLQETYEARLISKVWLKGVRGYLSSKFANTKQDCVNLLALYSTLLFPNAKDMLNPKPILQEDTDSEFYPQFYLLRALHNEMNLVSMTIGVLINLNLATMPLKLLDMTILHLESAVPGLSWEEADLRVQHIRTIKDISVIFAHHYFEEVDCSVPAKIAWKITTDEPEKPKLIEEKVEEPKKEVHEEKKKTSSSRSKSVDTSNRARKSDKVRTDKKKEKEKRSESSSRQKSEKSKKASSSATTKPKQKKGTKKVKKASSVKRSLKLEPKSVQESLKSVTEQKSVKTISKSEKESSVRSSGLNSINQQKQPATTKTQSAPSPPVIAKVPEPPSSNVFSTFAKQVELRASNQLDPASKPVPVPKKMNEPLQNEWDSYLGQPSINKGPKIINPPLTSYDNSPASDSSSTQATDPTTQAILELLMQSTGKQPLPPPTNSFIASTPVKTAPLVMPIKPHPKIVDEGKAHRVVTSKQRTEPVVGAPAPPRSILKPPRASSSMPNLNINRTPVLTETKVSISKVLTYVEAETEDD